MDLKRLFCLLTCFSLLTIASVAWSAEIHGRSSTQFQWYNDILTDKKVAEFGEYLNLSITKIDKADKLSIQGYGRITQDVQSDNGFNGRLYYLYADYRDLYDKIDFRLGRQFVNYAAGSALIDGGQVELKKVGPVAFSIMGGRNVFFDLKGEATRANDFVFGAAAYLTGFQKTDAELSYFAKWDKDGLARDQLGLSLKQYLFNSVKLYGNTRFELVSESFSELLVGAKYFPTSELILTTEWYQSYPTFDATSIYSVFGVERYQEVVLRADYIINDKITLNAGYNKQWYGDSHGESANVFEIGCRIRPMDHVQLNLNYDYRNGYGGKLNGAIAEVTYEPMKTLELAAGVHFDVFERERGTGFVDSATTSASQTALLNLRNYTETARKYWAGAKYVIAKNMSISARIEDNVNQHYKSDWAGRTAFNYNF